MAEKATVFTVHDFYNPPCGKWATLFEARHAWLTAKVETMWEGGVEKLLSALAEKRFNMPSLEQQQAAQGAWEA